MQVSFYPQLLDYKSSQTLELLEILAGIKNGRWEPEVLAMRALRDKAYTLAKRRLPCFTASGTFATRRDADLLTHSGLIALDIDARGANAGLDLMASRARIEADPHTYACFTSVGGRGLCVLVPIPVDRHHDAFQVAAIYYQHTYGVAVDAVCLGVSQQRFVSCDPALYLNEGAATFEETLPKPTGIASEHSHASEFIR
jgi:hypothetical protein